MAAAPPSNRRYHFMSYKIDEIEGIGPAYGKRLIEAGMKTTDALLDACADPKGRKDHREHSRSARPF